MLKRNSQTLTSFPEILLTRSSYYSQTLSFVYLRASSNQNNSNQEPNGSRKRANCIDCKHTSISFGKRIPLAPLENRSFVKQHHQWKCMHILTRPAKNGHIIFGSF